MGSYLATERSALDVYENHWRKLGYTLVYPDSATIRKNLLPSGDLGIRLAE